MHGYMEVVSNSLLSGFRTEIAAKVSLQRSQSYSSKES